MSILNADFNINGVNRVVSDAKLFGLDLTHMRFIEGYFNVSLPRLVMDEPNIRFSVVRLDGDTYFSTMDAIKTLYPRLNPGGFIIIDDYTDWLGLVRSGDCQS